MAARSFQVAPPDTSSFLRSSRRYRTQRPCIVRTSRAAVATARAFAASPILGTPRTGDLGSAAFVADQESQRQTLRGTEGCIACRACKLLDQ
jgi:hypothetical protein